MKRLWVSLGLLVLLFGLSLAHSMYLEQMGREMSTLLEGAEQAVQEEEWARAILLTQQAQGIWERQDTYLHISLHHSDTDEITESFRSVLELLDCQEQAQYQATNARLLSQIYLLWEAEQLSLKNVF